MQSPLQVSSKLTPWAGGFDELLRWGVDPQTGRGFCARQMMHRAPARQCIDHGAELLVFDHKARHVDVAKSWVRRDAHWARDWDKRQRWNDCQHTWSSGSYWSERADQTQIQFFESEAMAKAQLSPHWVSASSSTFRAPMAAFKTRAVHWATTIESSQGHQQGIYQGGQWQTYSRLPILGSTQLQVTYFRDDPDARLSAVGLWLVPAIGKRLPVTSIQAELVCQGKTYRFDRLLPSALHEPPTFDTYRWLATLINDEYRLEISADGGSPRIAPWYSWRDHRSWLSHKQAHMTTMANVRIRIFPRASQRAEIDLRSSDGFLLTLLPPD